MSVNTYFIYKFIQHLVPVYPVYLLLFEAKGLSVQQISLLLAIWSLPLVILEVPTGILADNWSRKKLLVAGSMLKASAYLIWLFAEGFWLFAAGFVLWGAAEAFVSGTEEALLYDSLKLLGMDSAFDSIYGRGNYYTSIAVAISCFSGGFLAAWFGMEFVLALSVASMTACTLITLRFREVNYYKERNGKAVEESLDTLKEALRLCTGNKLLLAVIALSVMVIGISGMLDEYDSLIADRFGLSLGFVGFWMSFRYVLEAIGGRLAFRLKHMLSFLGIRDGFEKVGLVCITAALMLGLSGWAGTIAVMPLYGLFYLLMASASVIHEDYIQQSIKEEGRSTVHSIISLAGNLYAMGFYSIFALVLAGIGILPALVVVAAYIVLLCTVISIIYLKIR